MDVLTTIAKLLLTQWKQDSGAAGKLPTLANLAQALGELQSFKFFKLPGGGSPTDATLIAQVVAAIQHFKDLMGLKDGSSLDQIFDKTAVNIALSACKDIGQQGAPPKDPDDKLGVINYEIDSSILNGITDFNPTSAIATAAVQWGSESDTLFFQDVTKEKNKFRNVTIKLAPIGPVTLLGRAPVAGIGFLRGPLTVEMNSKVTWTRPLFIAAVCHELGHIAGLGHSKGDNDLMSPVIPPSIDSPQQADLDAFHALWPLDPAEA